MNTTSEYLLLFRGTDWQKGLSPQELEETLGRFMAWFDRLQAEGKLKGASPLRHDGKLVSGANGRTVLDGPFAESKEAIGGYFLLTVADMNEAVSIARQCPVLEHGGMVEVRPVALECPLAANVRDAAAELAHA
ncbi:MAG: YciI family protein [Verrucomicrobiota bacterium]|nr:YciI family protein [Verrucomicrobiota bacterium]